MDALTDTNFELAPPPSAPAMHRRSGLALVRDGVSTYLPLLLMVMLALATWWLVKNAPQTAEPTSARPVTQDADYTMQGALLQRFDRDGRLRVQVQGERLRHFPDTDRVEIDAVRIRSYGADGSIIVATANKAVTNGDASQVELVGSAQVLREANAAGEALRFDSEFLRVFLETRRVSSHLPVTFQMGDNSVRAGGFEYDDQTQIAQLKGPVKVTALPSVKGGPRTKPGS